MIYDFNGKTPNISAAGFVADNATLIGEVNLGEGANIWYGAVLRADVGPITLGEGSNVQDNAVVHLDPGGATTIGKNVTIGHGAIIHGCTLEDDCLVGMGATLLNNCVVGKGSIIGAGALVPEGMIIPERSLVVGVPGKVRGTVSDEQAGYPLKNATHYVKLGKKHAEMCKK